MLRYVIGHPVYRLLSFPVFLPPSLHLFLSVDSVFFHFFLLSFSCGFYRNSFTSLRVPSVSLDRRLLLSLSLLLHCTLFRGVTLFLPNRPFPCSLASFLFLSLYLLVLRRCFSLVAPSSGLYIFFSRSLFRSLNRIHYLSLVFQFILSFSHLYIYF